MRERDLLVLLSLWFPLQVFIASLMEPCRYDMGCWRQELHERIVEQNVDVPVPQITVPVPIKEEIVEVDLPVPQIQEQIMEVAEVIRQGRTFEHTVGVPVPQILEEIVEVVKAVKIVPQERISARICGQIVDMPVPLDQPGDQICRIPADTVHRQGCCRYACGVAATGPSDSDCAEDGGSPARAGHRQNFGRACGQAVDAVTGPSDPDSGEDGGRPYCAVHR